MKPMNRRKLALLMAAACMAPMSTVHAQAYPEKPIRLVVPWPAGGGADAVGRAVAQALTVELGKSVFVENIAGAGGNIGTQQFIRSAPDGYTLLLATSSTNVANPYLYKKVGFDPIKDFTPVASVAMLSSVLVVPSSSPFKSPKDIIAAAQAAPGKLLYGSGGVGASAHLAGELFNSVAKIDITHVPYKGSGPALSDVMGGEINMMFDTGAFPHIKGGKIRALAVAAEKRHPLIPDVPTFEELGIKGMIMNAWYGVAAPAGTPASVVAKVNQAVEHALKSGELSKRLTDIGAEVRGGSPEAFATFWRNELVRYEGLVKLTGASLD
jgi:tripartite-type tricarboxylate transporter receptor subunit TctC